MGIVEGSCGYRARRFSFQGKFVLSVKATTVNRLNYNRRKLRVMYKTDKPSYQMWHMDNPSCAEKTDKRSFLFGNHNY